MEDQLFFVESIYSSGIHKVDIINTTIYNNSCTGWENDPIVYMGAGGNIDLKNSILYNVGV